MKLLTSSIPLLLFFGFGLAWLFTPGRTIAQSAFLGSFEINADNYRQYHGVYQGVGGSFIARGTSISGYSTTDIGVIASFGEDVDFWMGFRNFSDIQTWLTPAEVSRLHALGVTTLTYNPEGDPERSQCKSDATDSNPGVQFARFAEENGFRSIFVMTRNDMDRVPEQARVLMFQAGLDGIALQEQQQIEAHCVSERVITCQQTIDSYQNAANIAGRTEPVEVIVQIMSNRCAAGDNLMASCGEGNNQYLYQHCDMFIGELVDQGLVDTIAFWAMASAGDQSPIMDVLREGSLPTTTPTLTPVPTPTPPSSCPTRSQGDVSCDGRVNISDLVLVGANFGTTNTQADANGDGLVNIIDLVLVGANFGRAL